MTKVFLSGSMKIKNLDKRVIERLRNIVDSQFTVIVGDADGVDSAFQEYLMVNKFNSVLVYCTGKVPRNNLGYWETKNITSIYKPGTRDYFTAKDKAMADDCDYGFIVWDTRSTGTLSNAIELVQRNKMALVFINKIKQFLTIKNAQDLEELISFMSDTSLKKAEVKIGLLKKIELIKCSQQDLFNAQKCVPADTSASHV
ncbi:hypothetical protein ES708_05998 [subsurface metagenome]